MSADGDSVIRIKVLPRSSRNQIVGIEAGVLKIKLTAPPVEGKANKALVQFLAKIMGVPKKDIEIISGQRSTDKTIRVPGHALDRLLNSSDQ